jgi:uroporphyrinogen-III synthase
VGVSGAIPSFQERTVLLLESRRSREMAALVSNHGGRPVLAPALREIPLESNPEALAFADALVRGEIDCVVLLTGVGTRALVDVVERTGDREAFVAALANTKLVARGPKPVAVLRALQLPVWVTAPEPNTWRELLAALDATGVSLSGLRMAVQEYGVSNPELLQGLQARGAYVTRVPVYRWALPEDIAPLRSAVSSLTEGQIDVVIVTTATQVAHLFQIADTMGQADALRESVAGVVVASIGPTTTEALGQQGIAVDLEASHPKMGLLVREAAERSAALLHAKRQA